SLLLLEVSSILHFLFLFPFFLVSFFLSREKRDRKERLKRRNDGKRDGRGKRKKIVEKLTSLTRQEMPDSPGASVGDLTPRARDVLGFIARGLSDDDIASKIGISPNTVRNHVSAIYRATGVRKRSALVVWARERGLGTPEKAKSKQKLARAK
ncbi:MAG: response regulator transcription factor, partial [Rhodospirillales bacterium]|nr:response regulator transcription factor [Acetobacter sp.]